MIFGYKAYLQQILDASQTAQQIRSYQNEVLLSNATGESLFGLHKSTRGTAFRPPPQ